METIELAIKIRLSGQLHQQLSLFQQVRRTQTTDEAICMVLQEYFRLMSPQITQELIPFQPLWIQNVLQQQGVTLAQLQKSISSLEQLIQRQTALALSASEDKLQGSLDSGSCDNTWESVGLDITIAERGITGTKLAQRIVVSPSAISRKRNQSDFQHWTRDRDPYNIAWEYRTSTCRFHPVQPNT